ncbi:MAG: ABC transporter ATP-binding protein [Aliiglaciecola sp.]
MIALQNVCKSFQDGDVKHAVIKDLSLSFPQQSSISITGASGSGKSTLLHLLAALDTPDSGSIIVDDLKLTELSTKQADEYRKHYLGFVFQRFNLIDCLSVWDNLCFSARLTKRFDEDYIDSLVQRLGIEDLKHKLPQTLSGGEQQRVAIARALAHKPKLILADEPTGNLDDKNSENVVQLLFELCETLQTTLILVTHSQPIASSAKLHYCLRDGQLHPQSRDTG